MSESEIKRLASLKKHRQAFKAKQKMIKDALKVVDNNRQNKIIFDDDITQSIHQSIGVKNVALFDDDNHDEKEDVDFEKNFDANRKSKFPTIGGDERFKINSRFIENDDKLDDHESIEVEDEFTNEKKMQLDILNAVLGTPIVDEPIGDKGDKTIPEKRINRMVRYDPKGDDHHNYEIDKAEKVPTSRKKQKKSKIEIEPEEPVPVPVSNQIFYNVSDTLVDSLKTQEEFSLLKTFGSECPPGDKHDRYEAQEILRKKGRFQPDFGEKNPFKYDSSDDEEDNPLNGANEDQSVSGLPIKNIPLVRCDSFFFIADDPRFKEAEEFFQPKSVSEDEFKTIRRELKEIVRSKIRNNIRKNRPWKRKIETKSRPK